jgi:hypothetical protein
MLAFPLYVSFYRFFPFHFRYKYSSNFHFAAIPVIFPFRQEKMDFSSPPASLHPRGFILRALRRPFPFPPSVPRPGFTSLFLEG